MNIEIRERPVFDPYVLMYHSLVPQPFFIVNQDSEAYCRHQPIEATLGFLKNRVPFQDLLRFIVWHIFGTYKLPKDAMLEYGAGALGYFWAALNPGIKNWLQVEINPQAIEENRRQHWEANVVEGSYYDITFRNVPLIGGLSSWDTANDLPMAMDQLAGALRTGGYFFHMQDVRPGVGCVTSWLKQKTGSLPTQGFYEPQSDCIIAFECEGQPVHRPELFRRAIGQAIREDGRFDIVLNHYVTAWHSHNHQSLWFYFFNAAGTGQTDDTSLQYRKQATVIITLARRR